MEIDTNIFDKDKSEKQVRNISDVKLQINHCPVCKSFVYTIGYFTSAHNCKCCDCGAVWWYNFPKFMKPILDACCGSRMFWFDKNNTNVLFMDCRNEEITCCDGRRIKVKPDIVGDFTNMPFPDNSFKLVVFDPPHMNKLGKNTWMAQKYGVLLPTWETDLKSGFDECMRVLEPYGVLIFKWNEAQIKANRIIEIFGQQPLFGHPTSKHGKTIWMCYMKIPK